MSPEYVLLLNKINKLNKSICCVASSLTPTTQMSITSDTSGLMLVNDEDAPGAYQSYSTDSLGAKGWNTTVFGSGTAPVGTTKYLPVWDGTNTLSDSVAMESNASGLGRSFYIDDLIKGVTTTNWGLLVVRNAYPGDGSGNILPQIYVDTTSNSATPKFALRLSASAMPAGSTISTWLGRSASTRNCYIQTFFYNASGSTGNYVEDQFYAVANISRKYASGNTTFGSGVTTDNGFRVEVDTSLKVGTKLNIGTPANPSIGTATLVGGTVTVNTTLAATGSKIFITRNTPSGTLGDLSVPDASIVNGTSFVINSSSGTETSTINWWIIN